MASNEKQVAELLERLHIRTARGAMTWQKSTQPDNYQTRIGDFMVSIGPMNFGLLTSPDNISIKVTSLSDGQIIESISEVQNALDPNRSTRVPRTHVGMMKSIYELVVGGNSGIDELLKLLR